MGLLPDLPVDDSSLDLYWTALHPSEDEERTSIGDLLDLLSEMAGSDTEAVEEVLQEADELTPRVVVMRDPMYHPNDLIVALIEEVRRLRSAPIEPEITRLSADLSTYKGIVKRLLDGWRAHDDDWWRLRAFSGGWVDAESPEPMSEDEIRLLREVGNA